MPGSGSDTCPHPLGGPSRGGAGRRCLCLTTPRAGWGQSDHRACRRGGESAQARGGLGGGARAKAASEGRGETCAGWGGGELGPDSGPGWRAGGNAWRTGFRGGGARGRGRAGTGRNAPGPDHSAKPGGLDRLTCPKGQVRPGFRSLRPEGPSSSAGPALSMKPASPGQSAMGRARAARGLAGWEGQVAAGCPQAARRFMGPLVAARAATSIPLLRRREGLSARSCEGIVGGAARRVARAVSEPERSASRRPSSSPRWPTGGGEGGGTPRAVRSSHCKACLNQILGTSECGFAFARPPLMRSIVRLAPALNEGGRGRAAGAGAGARLRQARTQTRSHLNSLPKEGGARPYPCFASPGPTAHPLRSDALQSDRATLSGFATSGQAFIKFAQPAVWAFPFCTKQAVAAELNCSYAATSIRESRAGETRTHRQMRLDFCFDVCPTLPGRRPCPRLLWPDRDPGQGRVFGFC